ncbi:hypothetical protein Tco_1375222 [Tanacetum coccineum]
MAQQKQVLSKDPIFLVFKQYDLALANKKIDLTNPTCPPASKILGEILRRHPLCFALTASALVPWIYIQQVWHTLKLDDSKEKLTSMVADTQEDSNKILCCTNLGRSTYSLMHPTIVIPYLRFIKIIVDHILTKHPDISKRLNEPYHRVENDEVVKLIFNSGKRKGRGMRIPEWLLTEDMKQTKKYKMYSANFQIEVPMTQSQPTESTQGTHRTSSAPRLPNPQEQQGESSAQNKSTIIRIPRRRQPDPKTLILTIDQIDVDNLDKAI